MKIEQAINNLSFDAKIRANSSLAALKYVDLMIEDFIVRDAHNKSDILLDVFGLLQGLFVAIDALYQLSFTATKYKYNVNINSNRTLRHLKYLRNDIVGHPTNRNYEDGSFGFSIIIDDEITKDKLSYITYIIRGKNINKNKQTIYFDEVLKAYQLEKNKVLENLESYLAKTPHLVETTGLIVNLFEKSLNNMESIDDLLEIERKFIKENNLSKHSNHRFLHRLNLLKDCFTWKDKTYQEIIDYAKRIQILSIYQINLDINDKKIRIPVIDKPDILKKFRNIVNRNALSRKLISNLNDLDHPLFNSDLEQLIKLVKDPEVKGLLLWFQKIRDRDHSFLIGKLFKDILS
ncbi:hypothetical protein [Acholeplasma granularum]|uniref:hypothetical protein n=1 Tax=Acholeplasma granularum TaxID=264635 RepID=UPI0004716775|nr:hypothetical protein [Acholeplasma granularum]